jgi:hypothetical protein
MQFATIILLALPLVTAVPQTGTAPATPAPQAAGIIDRDAFNSLDRAVVLEFRKAE